MKDSPPPASPFPHPTSLTTLLIANRGEIASRVIRTCRKMGIRSVAVYSEADRDMPFVREADQSVYIGESDPKASYLDQDKLIQAAKQTGAQAIHPGYGFLSENVAFARRCAAEGLIFIGPNPEAIEAMGSKSQAKSLMQAHQVPTVPGYQGEDQSDERLIQAANEIGYPVLIKAAAGGGGKGMRIAHAEAEMQAGIAAAKREAVSAFGDAELIIEKYITAGRHIEFQIFGDQQGNVIHLLERECTLQRRYQKVIEESPSPVMTEELRARMGEAAVNAAKALQYDNAGTVEFIYDEKRGDFYFLEVNTRLQVEHPVTEAITGLDLVRLQIESAQGKVLRLQQVDIQGKGYAIECRLYAEDPANDFLPVTGTVHQFAYPTLEGLRVDSAIESGSTISVFYDPMIAKLIVWAESRGEAHQKMAYVLRQLVCLGTTTNQLFLRELVENEQFQAGNYDTHFIDRWNWKPEPHPLAENHAVMAACLFAWNERAQKRSLLQHIPSGWRNSYYQGQQVQYQIGERTQTLAYRHQDGKFALQIGESTYLVRLLSATTDQLRLEIDGIQQTFRLQNDGQQFFVQNEQIGNWTLTEMPRFPEPETTEQAGQYIAPMPSQIVEVLVQVGQTVSAGDPLMILSSMKMENTLLALTDGKVEEVYTTAGSHVEAGFVLLNLQAS